MQKINNSNRFWRLARLHHLDLDIPKSLFDQWQIFVQIIQNKSCDWEATLLLFPQEWFNDQDSPAIRELKSFLRNQEQAHLECSKQELIFSRVLGQAMNEINCKNPYFASTIRQIFAITNLSLPGFVTATSNLFLPLDELRNAFYKDYGMQTPPDLIIPGYAEPGVLCFYSIELETLLQQHGNRSKDMSSLEMLKTLQMIYNHIIQYLSKLPPRAFELNHFLNAHVSFIHDYAGKIHLINQSGFEQKNISNLLAHSVFARKGCIAIEFKEEKIAHYSRMPPC